MIIGEWDEGPLFVQRHLWYRKDTDFIVAHPLPRHVHKMRAQKGLFKRFTLPTADLLSLETVESPPLSG